MTATISEFDAIVAELVRKGAPRDKAEAAARAKLNERLSTFQEFDHGRANQLEKAEQAECVKIFRAHGCQVYSLSQARASKQTPGLADLFVFAPRFAAAWWFETKRPVGGEQSPAQRDFQDLCIRCGVRYVIGDREAAWQVLRDVGVSAP